MFRNFKSHAYNISFCIQQAKDMWQNCQKYCLLLFWRCHGQELLIYISISASEVCKTHLFVVFLAFHFFLTLLFQNSAICGVSASLLSKTGLLVAFLCAPTKDAPTGQLGMCRLGWLLRAVVPSVTSQIFQILSGWFWYKKNLATPGKECGSGLFIPIEILQLGRFFALSGGDQQLKFDSTEQCGACHIRFH